MMGPFFCSRCQRELTTQDWVVFSCGSKECLLHDDPIEIEDLEETPHE